MTRTAVGGLKNDLQYAKSAFQSDFAYFPSVDSKAHFGDYISKSNWTKSRLKRIRANPRHPRHPRSIDRYIDMKTALGFQFHGGPGVGENLFHSRSFGHVICVHRLRAVDP